MRPDISALSTLATITRGLISIAQGLGLSVTAEGVETREQLDLLYDLGVHHMQGNLFGKPMSAEEYTSQAASDPDLWTEHLPDP